MSNMFRSIGAGSDDNGVSDLLREVAQRNSCSLSDEQRREVSAMVKRVETHRARKTPIGKLKKKLADVTTMATATTASAEETTTSTNTTNSDKKNDDNNDNDNDGASHKSSKTTGTNHTTGSESVNKWGKDLIQKFSNMQTTPRKEQATAAASSTSKLDPKEVFRSFSAIGLPQNPLKHAPSSQSKPQQPTAFQKEAALHKEKAKQHVEKMKVAFERSSQSGRNLMKNFSKNFEKNLENLENFLLSPPPPEPPKAEFDKNSAEYQLDLKGIALLKQIFPEESNETLIKLHFEHLQASSKTSS